MATRTVTPQVLAETWRVYTWLFIGFAAIKGQNAASAPLQDYIGRGAWI